MELIVPEENLVLDLAEQIDLNIVEANKEFIVVDKLAGMVVHPGAGNKTGTLLNALLNDYPELKKLPRAGIVHRLDKDTSGLMVIARNEKSFQSLSDQISERSVKRIYQAFVVGKIERSGKIDAPIGRHPKIDRNKQLFIQVATQFPITKFYKNLDHIHISRFLWKREEHIR